MTSARFQLQPQTLAGLTLVERLRIGDERGSIERLFCRDELSAAGWEYPIAQINRTLTATRGTVRGMHYQRQPHAEAKLVSCLHGSVYDVAVDVRKGSPTFLQWFGAELSEHNRRAILIPPGFAHGFQSLSDKVELLYLHSSPYEPAAEAGLRSDDPELGISWPLLVTGLSVRDSVHPLLSELDFEGHAF